MAEYFLKGKKYAGPKHKMPDGKYHTGAKHTASSKPLTAKKAGRKYPNMVDNAWAAGQ